MAENKRSFLLYTDVHYTVKKLTDTQAGKLFKHILSYVNDENPIIKDIIIEIAFEPIKQALKRDLRKYEIIREKRSVAGKASAGKRQQVLTSVESVEQNEHVLTNATVSVIDSVIVNDNVNEDSKVMPNKSADFIDQIVNCFVEEHGSYEIVTPGKEREMAGKILALYKKKFPAATSDETLKALRIFFKQCMNINDDWLRANMSLSIIVTKFNVISKIFKNGNTKKTVGASDEAVARIIAEKFGVDASKQ